MRKTRGDIRIVQYSTVQYSTVQYSNECNEFHDNNDIDENIQNANLCFDFNQPKFWFVKVDEILKKSNSPSSFWRRKIEPPNI